MQITKIDRHKYILLLLLSTGMRIGEALVLDYDKDIDLENRKSILEELKQKIIAEKQL